jgi:aldehyde dehydrogenase (NAD+)
MEQFGEAPEGLSQVALGGAELGEALADDRRVPLVSATGSTWMGAIVGPRVTGRFGRALLELGGNNGMIVVPSADLDITLRAILFAAVGTAGQRCTASGS